MRWYDEVRQWRSRRKKVKQYGDGGEVDPPTMRKDLDRLKQIREQGISKEQLPLINKEIEERYGLESKMYMLAQTALNEGSHKFMTDNGGYDMDSAGMRAGSGVVHSSEILRKFPAFVPGVQYLKGEAKDLDDAYLTSLMTTMTDEFGSYGKPKPEAKEKTGAPPVVFSNVLPKGKTNAGNKGYLSGQQAILNQLIAQDTSLEKPQLLVEDDILGPMTRAAMKHYEGKGYKTPELFSEANVEQYKKNIANMKQQPKAVEKQPKTTVKQESGQGMLETFYNTLPKETTAPKNVPKLPGVTPSSGQGMLEKFRQSMLNTPVQEKKETTDVKKQDNMNIFESSWYQGIGKPIIKSMDNFMEMVGERTLHNSLGFDDEEFIKKIAESVGRWERGEEKTEEDKIISQKHLEMENKFYESSNPWKDVKKGISGFIDNFKK